MTLNDEKNKPLTEEQRTEIITQVGCAFGLGRDLNTYSKINFHSKIGTHAYIWCCQGRS